MLKMNFFKLTTFIFVCFLQVNVAVAFNDGHTNTGPSELNISMGLQAPQEVPSSQLICRTCYWVGFKSNAIRSFWVPKSMKFADFKELIKKATSMYFFGDDKTEIEIAYYKVGSKEHGDMTMDDIPDLFVISVSEPLNKDSLRPIFRNPEDVDNLKAFRRGHEEAGHAFNDYLGKSLNPQIYPKKLADVCAFTYIITPPHLEPVANFLQQRQYSSENASEKIFSYTASHFLDKEDPDFMKFRPSIINEYFSEIPGFKEQVLVFDELLEQYLKFKSMIDVSIEYVEISISKEELQKLNHLVSMLEGTHWSGATSLIDSLRPYLTFCRINNVVDALPAAPAAKATVTLMCEQLGPYLQPGNEYKQLADKLKGKIDAKFKEFVGDNP